MTNVRPHALTLAVALAVSSSIMTTQALADRRLQIKSFDSQSNKQSCSFFLLKLAILDGTGNGVYVDGASYESRVCHYKLNPILWDTLS